MWYVLPTPRVSRVHGAGVLMYVWRLVELWWMGSSVGEQLLLVDGLPYALPLERPNHPCGSIGLQVA